MLESLLPVCLILAPPLGVIGLVVRRLGRA
ncbi:hypothetical protein BH24ACT26_BH24ACT26_22890 [soil metagenome]